MQKAHAYIDFGTGGMVVQSIVASCIGVGFFFKDKIVSLLSFFTQGKAKDSDRNA